MMTIASGGAVMVVKRCVTITVKVVERWRNGGDGSGPVVKMVNWLCMVVVEVME